MLTRCQECGRSRQADRVVANFADKAVIAIPEKTCGVRGGAGAHGPNCRSAGAADGDQGRNLSVISNSLSDTQPVFDAIVESWAGSCFRAARIIVALADGDNGSMAAASPRHDGRQSRRRSTGQFRFRLPATPILAPAILDRRNTWTFLTSKIHRRNWRLRSATSWRAATPRSRLMADDARRCRDRRPGRDAAARPDHSRTKQRAVLKPVRRFSGLSHRRKHAAAQRTAAAHGRSGESLGQQTATSRLLGLISSSPGSLSRCSRPCWRETQTRICEAKIGILFRYENGLQRHRNAWRAPAL